jgi:hypothetical protein|tara:strand:+ start:4742 stop:4999 length:258 start_codon:yes stop_codon:yes gene_type:complete
MKFLLDLQNVSFECPDARCRPRDDLSLGVLSAISVVTSLEEIISSVILRTLDLAPYFDSPVRFHALAFALVIALVIHQAQLSSHV